MPLSGQQAVASATSAAIANNGTIATTGVTAARVAPTGNVTGVILAKGSYAGQTMQVLNESAYTVTFAAAATSYVADGATSPIPANTARTFTWSTVTGYWYRSA